MIHFQIEGSKIQIETDALEAEIHTEGYTSGVAAGTLRDKRTGARDLGFGLSIVDFLLEPADPSQPITPGQYEYGAQHTAYHGDIPKRYVEGPQICTQAKKLPFELIEGAGFLAIRQWFTWHQGYTPYQGGSRWQQTLVFTERDRFFFSSDRVTTVNRSPALFFRVDMPGHIKHSAGDRFEHVYLSYADAIIPSTEFTMDIAPDARNLYRRGSGPIPQRFIRAYQVRNAAPESGPWLAGMTLQPTDVYEAWCHQRGYVCMIEELGGWPTEPGSTFGAAYAVGWFDSVRDMHETYDRYRGWSGIELTGDPKRPTAFRGVKQSELRAI